MKKHYSGYQPTNPFCIFFVCIIGLLIFTACQKSDKLIESSELPKTEVIQPEIFFTVHSSSNPAVIGAQNFLKSQNNKHQFIDEFVNRIGMPLWNKALVYENVKPVTRIASTIQESPATVVYIPFVRDSQIYVDASVLIRMTASDTTYRILCVWQYSDFGFEESDTSWSARDIFNIFSQLDKSVFGYTKHRIKDGRIFGYPQETQLIATEIPETTNGKVATQSFELECRSRTVCITAPPSTNKVYSNTGGPATNTVCTTYTTCSLVWTGGDDPGPPPIEGGGGGGGGTGPGDGGPTLPPNPCPVLSRQVVTNVVPSNPCDSVVWEPEIILEEDPDYTCPANFTFVSVTTNNLWQEAELTNIYCNLIYMANGSPVVTLVRIPQLFFGMAYYNVDGNLVFSQNTAKATAADALNEAEREMRNRFSRYPTLTALQLQEYWVDRTNY